MSEVITLKCRCGNSRVHAGLKVDLAEFLRCALGDGWRRIDEEPIRAIECAGDTEIDLFGQCANCTGIENFHAKPAPAPRRFKTLHEILAARRGAR